MHYCKAKFLPRQDFNTKFSIFYKFYRTFLYINSPRWTKKSISIIFDQIEILSDKNVFLKNYIFFTVKIFSASFLSFPFSLIKQLYYLFSRFRASRNSLIRDPLAFLTCRHFPLRFLALIFLFVFSKVSFLSLIFLAVFQHSVF